MGVRPFSEDSLILAVVYVCVVWKNSTQFSAMLVSVNWISAQTLRFLGAVILRLSLQMLLKMCWRVCFYTDEYLCVSCATWNTRPKWRLASGTAVQRNKMFYDVSKYCYWKFPWIFVSSIAVFLVIVQINCLKIRREREREEAGECSRVLHTYYCYGEGWNFVL